MEIATVITGGNEGYAETSSMMLREGGVPIREVQIGETVTVCGVMTLVLISAPEGQPPIIDGPSVTPQELGRYRFRIVGGGSVQQLNLMVFEAGCIDRVPAMQNSGRVTPRSRGERRLVVRSIANHPDLVPEFDGRAETMSRGLHPTFGC